MAAQLSLHSPNTAQASYCPGTAQRRRGKLSTSSSDGCPEQPDLTVRDHKQHKAGVAEQTKD